MKDIGVIGGGVIGLTTAFVLEKYGDDNQSVTVLEKENQFGSKSTTAAGCGLRTVYSHPTNVELARKGLQFWRNADSILGGSIGFRENGYLFLTNSDKKKQKLASLEESQKSYGIPAESENPPSRRHIPKLNSQNYSFSLFSSRAALASPEKIVDALKSSLKSSGTNLRSGSEVVNLRNDEESVVVETQDDESSFDYVVNACGPWANEIAEMTGSQLPTRNSRRRLALLDLNLPEDAPLTVDIDTGVYILPTEDGNVLAGGHLIESNDNYQASDPESYSTEHSQEWNRKFNQNSGRLLDSLPESTVVESWTGLYTLTPSRIPVIDKRERMIHAAGFSGHGIMQAPGAAMLIARMLSRNSSHTDMFATLSADRQEPEQDLQF